MPGCGLADRVDVVVGLGVPEKISDSTGIQRPSVRKQGRRCIRRTPVQHITGSAFSRHLEVAVLFLPRTNDGGIAPYICRTSKCSPHCYVGSPNEQTPSLLAWLVPSSSRVGQRRNETMPGEQAPQRCARSPPGS